MDKKKVAVGAAGYLVGKRLLKGAVAAAAFAAILKVLRREPS